MLLGRPTRIELSQCDVRDYETRHEARQSPDSRPGRLRLSSTASHVTYACITKAQDNFGRTRANSCSTKATICSDDDDTTDASLAPSQDRTSMTDSAKIPLFDPGAPVFVPRARNGSTGPTTDSRIGRQPPFARPALPQRTSSRRLLRPGERTSRQLGDARDQSSHRSSPNLLGQSSHVALKGPRIRTRSSSLTWQGVYEHERRAPRAISGASAVSTAQSGTIRPELLSRESPLDELSQQLSRMVTNTHRPRSVGRSFERPPGRTRVSLRSGNPFHAESEPELTTATNGSDGYLTLLPPQSESASKERRRSLLDLHRLYELSLALPSPQTQSPPVLSGNGSPISSVPSSPMPDSTPRAAPHVAVYDDSLAAALQPQTPADLARSTARRHRHSPNVTRLVDGGLVDSPVGSVPRRGRNRQVHPSSTPAQLSPHNSNMVRLATGTPVRHTLLAESLSSPPSLHRHSPLQQSSTLVPPQERLSPRQQHAGSTPHSGLRRSHRSNRSGNSENDIEPALETIDEDRRTRVIREADTDLEITPPAEGRYERYFS